LFTFGEIYREFYAWDFSFHRQIKCIGIYNIRDT
jgi:hypothetical protein